MEKILLVINSYRPDNASIDFACRMAALTKSRLTGLFIENVYQPNAVSIYPEYYFYTTPSEGAGVTVKMDTGQAIKFFVEACAKHKVPCETYLDKGEPIQEVISESRFADLLIVDPKTSFYGLEDQLPSHFVKEILANAECPVILAPDNFSDIEEIVFCYDGSATGAYAFKQFTYLFPQLQDKKAVVLEISKTGQAEFDDDHRRLMSWLHAHYAYATYQPLKGDTKDELFAYFFKKQNKLVVMGAYGRNVLSNFFKHSAANVLIRTVDLPLFITHNQ